MLERIALAVVMVTKCARRARLLLSGGNAQTSPASALNKRIEPLIGCALESKEVLLLVLMLKVDY